MLGLSFFFFSDKTPYSLVIKTFSCILLSFFMAIYCFCSKGRYTTSVFCDGYSNAFKCSWKEKKGSAISAANLTSYIGSSQWHVCPLAYRLHPQWCGECTLKLLAIIFRALISENVFTARKEVETWSAVIILMFYGQFMRLRY